MAEVDDPERPFDNGPEMGRRPRHASDPTPSAKPDPGAEAWEAWIKSENAPRDRSTGFTPLKPRKAFFAGYRAGQAEADWLDVTKHLEAENAALKEEAGILREDAATLTHENAALQERVAGLHEENDRLQNVHVDLNLDLQTAEQRAEKMEKALAGKKP